MCVNENIVHFKAYAIKHHVVSLFIGLFFIEIDQKPLKLSVHRLAILSNLSDEKSSCCLSRKAT